MSVSVAQYVESLFPWDLSIEIDGKEYAVRPLTLGDLALLESTRSGGIGGMENVVTMLQSMFVDPKPDVMAWTADELMAVLAIISRYHGEQTKKNADRIAQGVQTPTNAPSESGR